jgi:hypothetical protein
MEFIRCSSSSQDSNPEKKQKVYLTRAKSKLIQDEDVQKKRNLIFQYSVDPYEYSDELLIEVALEIFHYYQLQQIFHFSDNDLVQFLSSVKSLYNQNNNFHNFKHAWGVMHMSFQLLSHGVDKYFSSQEIFAMLVAAICHDVGHPGNNNAFEFATESDVSKIYSIPNENCVLERYHVQLTENLLFPPTETEIENFEPQQQQQQSKPANAIVDSMNEIEKKSFFDLLNFIIMGTDMAKHGQLVTETQSFLQQLRNSQNVTTTTSNFSSSDSENGVSESKKTNTSTKNSKKSKKSKKQTDNSDNHSPESRSETTASPHSLLLEDLFRSDESRRVLARILVHTADIGAQTTDYPIAIKWVHRCYTEFQSQAAKEKELGIMTSPFMHDLNDEKKIFASQYHFIQGTAEPIWCPFSELFPELKFAADQLMNNKTLYKKFFE